MKKKSKWAQWGFLVGVATVVCFLPILRGEFLHWDDDALFVENSSYRDVSLSSWQWMCTTFLLGHWQPLSWLSYTLDHAVWAMDPHGWHVTNLLLHAFNASLVYLLCFAFRKENFSYAAAALAALFWAVHPLRVEAVAWLATRGYLLCGTFCLLTILFYLKAFEKRRYPLAALLCFVLATFTKGIGMMLPLALLLIDIAPLKRISSVRTARFCAIEKIPFFACSLLAGVMTFWSKNTHGGMAPVERYGLLDRLGQAVYGVWFYLLKTVSPLDLSPLYYKRPDASHILTALVLTAVSVIFFFLFRRTLRPLIAALGIFILMIFPMLGFTQSGLQFFADRFTYLASVPFSILLFFGLVRIDSWCVRFPDRSIKWRRITYGTLMTLLVAFGLQTFVFSVTWSNSLMLWHLALSRDENNVQAYNGMGQTLMDFEAYAKAIEYFDKALLLQPDYAAALQNRALCRVASGEYEYALADVSRALSLESLADVDRAKMLIARGQIAEKMGNAALAVTDYSAVIADRKIDPHLKMWALQTRARLYLEQGNQADGESDLRAILAMPGLVREDQNKIKQVLNELKKIPENNPGDFHRADYN